MTDRKSIENRYDFTILFDVKDGNPNGIRTPATCRESTLKLAMVW